MRRISSASIPHASATASGVKPRASARDLVEPVDVLGERRPRSTRPSSNSTWTMREQQVRVGARADEVVLVGLLGRAAAARVDHDDAAAALPDRAQPAAHVGRGQQAAVGGERVGAEHQQVVGAVDVGHRDR